jgi:hypothetical protein
MPNNLDVLPSDLLSRLDQVLPLITQSAIRAEFLQGFTSSAPGCSSAWPSYFCAGIGAGKGKASFASWWRCLASG